MSLVEWHDEPFDAAGREDREARLADLSHRVAVCTLCDLARSRMNTVFGSGDPASPLMIVGEGPAENDNAAGLPFAGRSGKLLDDILAAIDLSRGDVYLTNIVKCRPAAEKGGRLRNRPPKASEVNACNPYLRAQIEAVCPAVVLCLGGPAAKTLIDKGFRITKDRGKWHDLGAGYGAPGAKVMATLHPAYLLRQRGEDLQNAKRLVWEDIQAVHAEYRRALEKAG